MPKPISYCSIPGCVKRCVGQHFCRTHYARWYRYGDPLATPRFDPIEVRFWRYVDKSGECWVWRGAQNRGYGTFVISQRPTRAVRTHRYAYELLRGPIPPGLTLDHLCHNKSCVNPDHLEPVTSKENQARYFATIATCPKGHAYTESNMAVRDGKHVHRCMTCDREYMRRRRSSMLL